MALIPCLVPPALVLASVGYVMADADPPRYILDYVLPHPFYRSTTCIAICILFRIVLIFFLLLEILRTLAFDAILLTVMMYRFSSILRKLEVLRETPLKLYKLTSACLIAAGNFMAELERIVCLTFNLFFIACVSLVWICLKGSPDSVGLLLYYACLLGSAYIIISGLFVVRVCCRSIDKFQEYLESAQHNAWNDFINKRTVSNKITLLQVRGQRSLRIKYNIMGYLGVKVANSYCYLLLNKCIDALLTFHA